MSMNGATPDEGRVRRSRIGWVFVVAAALVGALRRLRRR